MIPSPQQKELSIFDYFQILKRHIWIIIVFVVAGAVAPSLYDIISPNSYEASTHILIQEPELKLVDPKRGSAALQYGKIKKEDFQAKLNLLSSDFIAERVIKALDLPITRKKIKSMVNVQPITRSNLISITVKGGNPKQIADIANAWVREFIRQDIERSMGVAEYGVSKLENQITNTIRNLQESEIELSTFLREHGDLAEQEELVDRLQQQKTAIEEEIVDSSSRYMEKHQKMISLRRQLEDVTNKLQQEREKLWSIQKDLSSYNALKKKADTYKNLYEELIERSKQLDMERGLAVSGIRIFDVAQIPNKPMKISPKFKWFMFFAALLMGVSSAYSMEALDSTLKTPEDVEFYAKLPFLGYIPLIKGKEKDRYLASHKDQFSITAEAFRNIKVSLLFSAPENKPAKSILVTSATPKEGKSLVASNLATVFAQEGKPTLLIDADMRGGKLAGTFDIDITPGMSEVLSGNASVDEVVKETQVPNLSIIPSGVHIPNPIDILNTENFEKLFEVVSSRFEKIIIDIPSVLTFTDSLFWERKSDYLVMVIKSGSTQLKSIEEAKKKFLGKVSLAGAVLNKTEVEKDLKYYLHYFEKTMKNVKREK